MARPLRPRRAALTGTNPESICLGPQDCDTDRFVILQDEGTHLVRWVNFFGLGSLLYLLCSAAEACEVEEEIFPEQFWFAWRSSMGSR